VFGRQKKTRANWDSCRLPGLLPVEPDPRGLPRATGRVKRRRSGAEEGGGCTVSAAMYSRLRDAQAADLGDDFCRDICGELDPGVVDADSCHDSLRAEIRESWLDSALFDWVELAGSDGCGGVRAWFFKGLPSPGLCLYLPADIGLVVEQPAGYTISFCSSRFRIWGPMMFER
jgi:hypothetical protein